jgi:hypothetical protein
MFAYLESHSIEQGVGVADGSVLIVCVCFSQCPVDPAVPLCLQLEIIGKYRISHMWWRCAFSSRICGSCAELLRV